MTLLQDDETVSEEEKVDVMRLMSVNQFPSSVGTVEIVSGRGQLRHLVGFRDHAACVVHDVCVHVQLIKEDVSHWLFSFLEFSDTVGKGSQEGHLAHKGLSATCPQRFLSGTDGGRENWLTVVHLENVC